MTFQGEPYSQDLHVGAVFIKSYRAHTEHMMKLVTGLVAERCS